ncbi:MAG: class I adenylate-forming enzyme family protein [Acidimicrobiales bacterium]|jgi:acyl-CoA synthetase (AMP-forming)/AMP-acid ligase II
MAAQLLVGDVFRAAARATPQRLAAALGDEAITFGQLDAAADRIRRALRARGVGHHDRVAGWSGTTLGIVPVFAALARSGVAFAPMSPLWNEEEAEAVLRRLRPALLVVDEPRAAAASSLGRRLGWPVASLGELGTDDDAAGSHGGADAGAEETEVSETDTHVVFFTSGSSGTPKGAMVSHRASVLRTLPGALLEPRGAMVCSYPLFHMGAWTIALQQWQARDAVVFVTVADAAEIIGAVERHRATRLNCVPAVWTRILRALAEQDAPSHALSTLRFADTGTSATPPAFLDALRSALPRAQVRVFYGSTEAGCVTVLEHADLDRKQGSCGVPGPLAEVRVDGGGRLLVRGPLLFDGYFDDPRSTAEALADGWYDTGDLADVDDEGYVSIIGRAREVIRTGGEAVTPGEIEAVLRDHPALVEVAVVGLPDVEWGEVVCAVVVVAPGAEPPDVEALRVLCAGRRLASYKHPRRVAVVDRIPRTAATGQVQRRLLVEQLS